MRMFRAYRFILILLAFASGCNRDDAPVSLRAQEVFAKAKQAMARADHAESKRLLQEALGLYERAGDVPGQAETSLLLGETYSAAAGFDNAVTLFAQARNLYQRTGDKSGVRAAIFGQAGMHRVRGEEWQAFSVLMDQHRFEEALGDSTGARLMKWELVPVSRAVGDFALERRLLGELLNESSLIGDDAMLAQVHSAYGNSSISRSEYGDAVRNFAAALPFALRSQDTLLTIQTFLSLAVVYDLLGNEKESFQMFTEGIRRADMIRGADALREEMLLRVGNIHLRRNRYEEAHKFYNAALRTAIGSQNRLTEAYALLQLGHCLAASGDAEAETNYSAAIALLDYMGLPRANAYARACLGNLAQSKGRLNEALALHQSAAKRFDSSWVPRAGDAFDDCEATFYGSRQGSPYDALIELLFKLGKSEEATAAAERERQSRLLRDYVSMTIRTQDARLNAALADLARVRAARLGAERQLAKAFMLHAESRTLAAEVQSNLQSARLRTSELEDSLAVRYPNLRPALTARNSSVADVQKQIPDGAALVTYIPTKQSLHISIYTKSKSSEQIAAIGKESLLSLMNEYLDVLMQMNAETNKSDLRVRERRLRELSGKLYAVFVRPIVLHAPDANSVFVEMPVSLPIIPVHALQSEGYTGEYALRRFSIRYLVEAGAAGTQRQPLGPYAVAVGFGNRGRTPIDAEYEVRDVKAFYKEARVFFDREATLSRLRQEKGDVLHASFELDYRTESPGLSFFVLSEGAAYGTTHFHRLGEMFSVAPFRIVLFSNLADAGLHPAVPGIFIMNGSSDIVINSYVPPRKAKKFFNELFYTNLLAGESAENAYRKSLLEMIGKAEYATPHMWAGFSLW
ncbi:MAG: CHAT domain-containing protein [Bacteroidetes bacterium]|nr:CHAT domain-containing protein [Bacteroidota bacterium]MCW5894636.1 CHAT domain-containing protein [Bacteroidota bacterium]